MFWLRLSGWFFVALVIATAAVMLLGSRLPQQQVISATAVVNASPDRLFTLLSDPAAQPHWRSDVAATELLPEQNDKPCWVEQHGRAAIPVCVVEMAAPGILDLRTVDPHLPFAVDRRFLLAADGTEPVRTRVTVIEQVSIVPPMLRFYEHYVLGDRTRVDQLLRDLVQGAVHATGR